MIQPPGGEGPIRCLGYVLKFRPPSLDELGKLGAKWMILCPSTSQSVICKIIERFQRCFGFEELANLHFLKWAHS